VASRSVRDDAAAQCRPQARSKAPPALVGSLQPTGHDPAGAEKGIGALSFAFIEPEDARHWVADYESTLREKCVPVGAAVNAQVACVRSDDVRQR